MFKKVIQFVRESRDELKRVTWPDRDEVTSFTMIVIVAVVIVSLFLYGVDTVLGMLVKGLLD
ncbi:MAG TPA: preprotein translocase subunit SecE [Spirochaetota bacterium]|nr:preprotein translocase subunit SecE [Spirochaetota bacterium]HNT11219.1 preprotein translocase subunit SecE [Spirochaetota bacterium]HNV46462.1 preprotein translocase subunit SecE [Spirochaetota bacterium]HOS41638.1 preprotein translocase subunit SecE [Spirochaetota bacterium]HPU90561.1 preprotein translocase subunit SecE [Spirochaetota bacterium]